MESRKALPGVGQSHLARVFFSNVAVKMLGAHASVLSRSAVPPFRQRSRLLMRSYVNKNHSRCLLLVAVLVFISLLGGCGTTGVTANQTTTAGTHLVELSWNPSSTSSVIKYNVYRSLQAAGPFDLLNSAAGAAYTDSTVKSGQTYYYA